MEIKIDNKKRKICLIDNDGRESFIFGGFWGPFCKDPKTVNNEDLAEKGTHNFINDKVFSLLKDCGINFLIATGTYSDWEGFNEVLDKAEQFGMVNTALDTEISNWCGNGYKGTNLCGDINSRISAFINHPACVGLYLYDEPVPELHDNIAKVCKAFYSEGKREDKCLICTLPGFLGVRPDSQISPYQEIISYVEKTNARFLTFDFYVWDEGQADIQIAMKVYSLFHYASEKYNIPVISMMQVGGKWSPYSKKNAAKEIYPNKAQFYWNFHLNLAYGFKGIAFFPLIQPIHFSIDGEEERDYTTCGLFGADGSVNEWAKWSIELNKHLRSIESILLNSISVGIIASGDEANVAMTNLKEFIPEGKYKELIKVEGEALVGCFDYEGKTALYVLNFKRDKNSTLKLIFDRDYKYIIYKDGTVLDRFGDSFSETFEAGNGCLIVVG